MASSAASIARNVLGGELGLCCLQPRTGFFRDGFCKTNKQDQGRHLVCALITQEFLDFTRARGNDLQTPAPHFSFPGLVAGDKVCGCQRFLLLDCACLAFDSREHWQWCLCVLRWKEALEAGVAPPVVLESTHENALQFVTLEELRQHSTATHK